MSTFFVCVVYLKCSWAGREMLAPVNGQLDGLTEQ